MLTSLCVVDRRGCFCCALIANNGLPRPGQDCVVNRVSGKMTAPIRFHPFISMTRNRDETRQSFPSYTRAIVRAARRLAAHAADDTAELWAIKSEISATQQTTLRVMSDKIRNSRDTKKTACGSTGKAREGADGRRGGKGERFSEWQRRN